MTNTSYMTREDAILLWNHPDINVKNIALKYYTEEQLNDNPLNLPKKWEDLKNPLSGYFIDKNSDMEFIGEGFTADHNRNIFANEKYAESALAYAQLSQLVTAMNGDWEPDFDNLSELKYSIYNDHRADKLMIIYLYVNQHYLLNFRTKELAEFSIKHHADLWKKFYML